jgi:phosphoribosylanthranilate isomerase
MQAQLETKSMTVQVKICGIATADDYLACRDAGASWVGVVHYPGSPRHLAAEDMASLAACAAAAAGPQRVLLTVDVVGDALAPLIAAARPDMLQLHGQESPDAVKAIKQRFGLPVIKAVAVETADDLAACGKWHGLAEWLLFDAKVKAGARPGGTGHSFDWSLLKHYRGQTPWMLAGGLNSATVGKAVAISGARAVDVSSGVESRPGKKDATEIHTFIRAAQLV